RSAAARAIDAAARAVDSPTVLVVDPKQLAPAKDPDAFIRSRGGGRWAELLQSRLCGVTWHAMELVGTVDPSAPAAARREALARAGAWLGRLPARLSLEQEDAINV